MLRYESPKPPQRHGLRHGLHSMHAQLKIGSGSLATFYLEG